MNVIENIVEGQVLLIDKPLHWTSFQVVNRMRSAIKRRFDLKKIKVGHAGTLDPLATGLLIICTGKFTKKIDDYQALYKEYTGTFTVGTTTPSYDLETEFDAQFIGGIALHHEVVLVNAQQTKIGHQWGYGRLADTDGAVCF